ncbi:MAG: hypothetical protein Q8M31_08645 [Beijerinckiaceae bacterium]|nr:hypothetical protein [Beijerinckiaceae bacterium]
MRGTTLWIGAAGILTLAAGAQAQGMPDSLNMSCAQAHALVQRSGAIVIATGPTEFERYVSGRSFCNPDQEPRSSFVRSADDPQCYIGDRCVDVDYPIR